MQLLKKVLVILACLVALGPSTVHLALAQDDTATTAARQRFKEGVRYFDKKQYPKARVAFAQAYALKQHPDVLLNLALSELKTPGYEVEAATHLSEYLSQVPDSAKREEAVAALQEAKQKIVTIRVQVDVEGAEVLVNDQHHAFTPMRDPIFAKPGTTTILVKSEAGSKSQQVTGTAGLETTVNVALAPPPETAPPPPSSFELDETEGGKLPVVQWFLKKPAAMFLGILTVGGIGSGIGFQIGAKKAYNKADDWEKFIVKMAEAEVSSSAYLAALLDNQKKPCGDDKVPPVGTSKDDKRYAEWCSSYDKNMSRGDGLRTVAYVSYGVAVASAIGLGVYYVVDRRKGKKEALSAGLISTRSGHAAVEPLVGPGFGGLTFSGRF